MTLFHCKVETKLQRPIAQTRKGAETGQIISSNEDDSDEKKYPSLIESSNSLRSFYQLKKLFSLFDILIGSDQSRMVTYGAKKLVKINRVKKIYLTS